MLAPLISVLAFQQATPAIPPQTPFSERQVVAEPERLALTPSIDGNRASEEWDPLVKEAGMEAFFQWEPRRLHMAGTLPLTHDLVFSLDLRGDGWQKGRDNLEIRFTLNDGIPVVRARVLDARSKETAIWSPLEGISVACSAAGKVNKEAKTWFVEATLEDPGLGVFPEGTGNIGIRADAIAKDASDREALAPRILTPVHLRFDRAVGLPDGIRWKPENAGISFTPSEQARVRLTFSSKDEVGLKRVDIRSEGLAYEGTNRYSYKFPGFDNKGRAFVDYVTPVKDVPTGYRVMRATIAAMDGAVAAGQVSYRVAPTIDFSLVRQELKASAESQLVRMTVFVRSNTGNRVDGTLVVLPPSGFEVKNISGKSFVLYGKASARRVFDLQIPPDARGTFPVAIRAVLGDKAVEQTAYVTIL